MSMKAIALSAMTSALLAGGTALAESRSYELAGFEKVAVSAGVDAEITVGPEFSVTAEGDARAVEKLDLRVEKGVLEIGRKSSWSFFQRSGKATVKVTLPMLSAVIASSGADVAATGVDAAEFRVKASSGAHAAVSGQCIGLSIEASSGADIDAVELICEMATAEASSGGDADLFASKNVIAQASSGGDLTVHGAPETVDIDESSGGDVEIVK